MCVIIIKQQDKIVSYDTLKNSARLNPHGLGIVWLDTFDVTYHKSNEYAILDTDRPYIAHFRYATIGVVSKANTHPFVCGRNTDEMLMMNGTIRGYGTKLMTDTEDLAIQLGKMPRHEWKSFLSKFDARFVSVNLRNKTFQIYNRYLYTLVDGVWYSKTNVLQENVVAVYGTLKKGFNNYNHYLTSSTYVGRGRTRDRYPLIVKGLPYLIEKKGQGTNVIVDVFKVSDGVMNNLDALEGHPNWYIRKQIPINIGGKTIIAWIYFNPSAEDDWNGRNHVESYEQYNLWKYRGYEDMMGEEQEEDNTCAQHELFDTEEDADGVCVYCSHDLQHDGFQNYYCSACDSWFIENDVNVLKR